MWTWGEPWGNFSMQVDRTPRRGLMRVGVGLPGVDVGRALG